MSRCFFSSAILYGSLFCMYFVCKIHTIHRNNCSFYVQQFELCECTCLILFIQQHIYICKCSQHIFIESMRTHDIIIFIYQGKLLIPLCSNHSFLSDPFTVRIWRAWHLSVTVNIFLFLEIAINQILIGRVNRFLEVDNKV